MGDGLYLATSVAATAATDHRHPRFAKRWTPGNDHSGQQTTTMLRANGSSEFLQVYDDVSNIPQKQKKRADTIQEYVFQKTAINGINFEIVK